MENKKKKVAIVGYTSTKDQAPFNNEEFEIWGLNDLYKFIPRYDRWFQLHTAQDVERARLESPKARETYESQIKILSQMKGPVYMQKVISEVPNSVEYPLLDILNYFAPYFLDPNDVKYFTNSVSYMVALAIYEKFEEIHIYGVDMAVDTEFKEQRASCEFWLGVAVGRGIKIYIPTQSDLLKSRFLYAYEEEKKHKFMRKIDLILQDIDRKEQHEIEEERKAHDRRLQYMGAKMGVKEVIRNWE